MPAYKIRLKNETAELVSTLYSGLHTKKSATITEKIEYVLDYLLSQWDASADSSGLDPEPVQLSIDLEAALQEITEPNIGMPIRVKHTETTPRSTDGLVPWEYILAGYSTLPFIEELPDDPRATELVRTLLTRIPEDQWESEQTKSIVARALSSLV
jgi:hypothetical protein